MPSEKNPKDEWDELTGNIDKNLKQPEDPVEVCSRCNLDLYVHLSRCPRCGNCIGCN